MTGTDDSLGLFHPVVAEWFRKEYGTPTEAQGKSWPLIAEGRHLLVTAPTGSGKTLTAFLWALNCLFRRENDDGSDGGAFRVLYISPLKALNSDIERNLRHPIRGLNDAFAAAGLKPAGITVAVRSGDTPARDREKMMRYPPDIFITTPESLNILLSSRGGKKLLHNVSTVILDEIHAVAGTKRGVYLMSAVERLTGLSGEFQRIALSATVRPVSVIADFIGGYRLSGTAEAPAYGKRPVTAVTAITAKRYSLSVDFPPEELPEGDDDWWKLLTRAYSDIVMKNRSTLLFVNSRRMAEKAARFIREDSAGAPVYAHHGSLSREIRYEVERKLAAGELAGIAATGSLELGIDIGYIDAVVLIQCPMSAAQTIQRIGRSGHKVGDVSRGIFYPIHIRELISSAVLSHAGEECQLGHSFLACRRPEPVILPLREDRTIPRGCREGTCLRFR